MLPRWSLSLIFHVVLEVSAFRMKYNLLNLEFLYCNIFRSHICLYNSKKKSCQMPKFYLDENLMWVCITYVTGTILKKISEEWRFKHTLLFIFSKTYLRSYSFLEESSHFTIWDRRNIIRKKLSNTTNFSAGILI